MTRVQCEDVCTLSQTNNYSDTRYNFYIFLLVGAELYISFKEVMIGK